MDYSNFIDELLEEGYGESNAGGIVRHLLEEARTLVIHQSDPTTDFLKAIYQGKGYPVLTSGMAPWKLAEELKRYDNVFALGHGSPNGLFAKGGGYIIDDSLGPVLREKQNSLYIWCYASDYARRHKLSGLVSGMFISEVGEADYMGIRGVTQEEVNFSNDSFARAVRGFLDGHLTAKAVKQCYSSNTCRITQYNNERLVVMRNGRG